MCTIPAHKLAVVGHLRLGAKALQMAVFSLQDSRIQQRDHSATEDHDGHSRLVVRHMPCPLCDLSPLDVYHLACDCTHISMIAWRASVVPAARQLLANIARLLLKAHDEMNRDESELCSEVTDEASSVDFDTDMGRFILFRLLIFHPWSARLAGSDMSLYTVRVVGDLFDAAGMPNMFLRPLADAWGYWSIHWAWRLGNAWREAHAIRA